MLDVVFASMVLAIPLLGISLWMVRTRRDYSVHRTIQMVLSVVLLIAVILFEVEIRMFGWTDRAMASPFWVAGGWNDWIDGSLAIHLLFAIPTPFLWAWVLLGAVRKFPRPPEPNDHSRAHRFWGRLAMGGLTMTAITGSIFYVLAFVAS